MGQSLRKGPLFVTVGGPTVGTCGWGMGVEPILIISSNKGRSVFFFRSWAWTKIRPLLDAVGALEAPKNGRRLCVYRVAYLASNISGMAPSTTLRHAFLSFFSLSEEEEEAPFIDLIPEEEVFDRQFFFAPLVIVCGKVGADGFLFRTVQSFDGTYTEPPPRFFSLRSRPLGVAHAATKLCHEGGGGVIQIAATLYVLRHLIPGLLQHPWAICGPYDFRPRVLRASLSFDLHYWRASFPPSP